MQTLKILRVIRLFVHFCYFTCLVYLFAYSIFFAFVLHCGLWSLGDYPCHAIYSLPPAFCVASETRRRTRVSNHCYYPIQQLLYSFPRRPLSQAQLAQLPNERAEVHWGFVHSWAQRVWFCVANGWMDGLPLIGSVQCYCNPLRSFMNLALCPADTRPTNLFSLECNYYNRLLTFAQQRR